MFARDTVAGTTTRVSLTALGAQANGDSNNPVISADGRYIAFDSAATNLVSGDTNGNVDVIVRANPQPAVTGITPATLSRGVTTPVTITGSGFIAGTTVAIDGSDHTVSDVTVVSPTTITANVTVNADAALTTRSVVVNNPGTGPGANTGASGICYLCVTVN